MAHDSSAAQSDPELEWIQMRRQINSVDAETTREKFARKFKENPLIPVGCLATAVALSFGLYSFRKGNRQMSQMMMRTRIAAQGFTVGALIIGVMSTFGSSGSSSDQQ